MKRREVTTGKENSTGEDIYIYTKEWGLTI